MACALFRWTLTRTRWLWTWRVCGVPSRRFDAQLELYQPLFSLAMGGQNTRLVVVAHLFGSRAPLDEVVSLARQHNLMVVEDAAEAFVGHSYKGHDDVDISLFSFGTIKTATALGGCVARVKNSVTRARMTALQAGYVVYVCGLCVCRVAGVCGHVHVRSYVQA